MQSKNNSMNLKMLVKNLPKIWLNSKLTLDTSSHLSILPLSLYSDHFTRYLQESQPTKKTTGITSSMMMH